MPTENIVVSASALEKAHALVGRLAPGQLAAVVHVMEAMLVEDDEGELTDETRQRLMESRAFFANGGQGIPMEEVLADFGLSMADFPLNK